MLHLKVEWKVLGPDQIALILDKQTFAAFQSIADAKGLDTQDMMIEALVALLGPILAKPL